MNGNLRPALALPLWGALLCAGCGNSRSSDAIFDMSNDTYDAVDVYIGGQFIDTIPSNSTHSYDLGPGGVVYNIQIYEAGDQNFQLNNDDVSFPPGVTTWDVFDNAPVISVQNAFALNEVGAECALLLVDGQSETFDLTGGTTYTPPADTQVCPQETGFFLVDYGTHDVVAQGVTSGTVYINDSQAYTDATHVNLSFPSP